MKGQMEIMGLVAIVIIFILGGLMYLFFSSTPPDTSMAETRESAETGNLLNAIMKTTPCKEDGEQLSMIIQECYSYNGNKDYCGEPECKKYIKEVVDNITKAYNNKIMYIFDVRNGETTFISQETCNTTKKMVANTLIRYGKTTLKASLTGCSSV